MRFTVSKGAFHVTERFHIALSYSINITFPADCTNNARAARYIHPDYSQTNSLFIHQFKFILWNPGNFFSTNPQPPRGISITLPPLLVLTFFDRRKDAGVNT
ncbi:hypothetical protein GQP56_000816 [Salmonella enterica subsp. enterica serovar Newport]|nr:hypothetical protein [Salmonella enterica subsp. enterica serovar Newport]EDR8365000.1 hypothetical protein [Salmonella enterica subsp. enterica serovar Newport]